VDDLNGTAGTAGTGDRQARRSELFLLPNLFSLARIVLAPVFVILMVRHEPWPAFLVFLAAGATDALDGFTARTFKLRSTLGLWLDPIGDKLLLTAAFVVLTIPAIAVPNALPIWLTTLCIGRDVAIALGALVIIVLRGKRTFPPSLAGKASTICQVFLMYAVLYLNVIGKSPESLGWLYVLTALLAAVSFAQYVFVGLRMLRAPRPVPPAP
jgi:cardiolipin synthase (CMP-forming)